MKRSERLTARQKQVLAFVEDRKRETGFAPTLHETADHFGFRSPNSVRQHLRLIEKKGFLHRIPRRSRALVVVRVGTQNEVATVRVPLLGRIPAGNPALANEDQEMELSLPSQIFRGRRLFALRAKGSSMRDAGIIDGDIVVLDADIEAHDGSIAAVLIDDEATLKRVFRRRDGLLLKAENPEFSNITLTQSQAEQTRIAGVAIGLVRSM